jgi:hypothetical protein
MSSASSGYVQPIAQTSQSLWPESSSLYHDIYLFLIEVAINLSTHRGPHLGSSLRLSKHSDWKVINLLVFLFI